MLQKSLGPMLLDFDARRSSKFKFSLTGGSQKCVLKDLKLDPEFLSKWLPGIPFVVESGVIDTLTIHARLHSIKTEPTIVEVNSVTVVVKEVSPAESAPETTGSQSSKDSRLSSLNPSDELDRSCALQKSASSGSLNLSAATSATSTTASSAFSSPFYNAQKGAGGHQRSHSNGSGDAKPGRHGHGVEAQIKETAEGVLRKADKKKYSLAQKIGDGIHWKVREVRLSVLTSGRKKSGSDSAAPPKSFDDPPALNILIRDLDVYSTDELGRKCDLKRARAFGKHLEDINYLFKEGSCFMSLYLTPSNPWFNTVTLLESIPLQLKYCTIFEPKWQTAKGEDVSLEVARSLSVISQEPVLCHLNGDDVLHVGDCLRGLSSALFEEHALNEHQYGIHDIPKEIIKVVLPELVLSLVLDSAAGGGAGSAGGRDGKEGGRGLALKVQHLTVGVVSGPQDYKSTTQLEVGSISLVDLGDPTRVFVKAPSNAHAPAAPDHRQSQPAGRGNTAVSSPAGLGSCVAAGGEAGSKKGKVASFLARVSGGGGGRDLQPGAGAVRSADGLPAAQHAGPLPNASSAAAGADGTTRGTRKEMRWCSIHPLELEAEAAVQAGRGRETDQQQQGVSCSAGQFLRVELLSCVPMWSKGFRTPGAMHELEAVVSVDGPELVVDQHLVDYVLCIQTLVTMTRALSIITPPASAAAAAPGRDEVNGRTAPQKRDVSTHGPANAASFGVPPAGRTRCGEHGDQGFGLEQGGSVSDSGEEQGISLLQLRSRLDIRILRPIVMLRLPARPCRQPHDVSFGASLNGGGLQEAEEDEYGLAAFCDEVCIEAEGRNPMDKAGNLISFDVVINTGGLYCNSHLMAADMPASASAGNAGSEGQVEMGGLFLWPDTRGFHKLLGFKQTTRGQIAVEIADGGRVRVGEIEVRVEATEVTAMINTQVLRQLLCGISDRFGSLAHSPAAGTGHGGGVDSLTSRTRSAAEHAGTGHCLEAIQGCAERPMLTVTLDVKHASIHVGCSHADEGSNGRGSDGRARHDREDGCVQLVTRGIVKVDVVSGVVAALEVRVPQMQALSRGDKIVWNQDGGDRALMLIMVQRKDLATMRRTRVMPLPLPRWESVQLRLDGPRLLVSPSLVSDVALVLDHLLGLLAVSRDLARIVSQLVKALSLKSLPTSPHPSNDDGPVAADHLRAANPLTVSLCVGVN